MLPSLERAGYAVFAISYDRVADLRAFADAHRIEYPLLADEGSRVIRALGVLDDELEAHHAEFGVPTRPDQLGVAYPMTVVLDDAGRVERKIVEANYRVRNGGRWLLEELLGSAGEQDGPRLETATSGPLAKVSCRAWLEGLSYFPFQRLGLHLELSIARGWHIYGASVPSGYTALQLDLASHPDGARLGRVSWPPPAPLRIEGLTEEFSVYEGKVAVTVPVEFAVPRNSGAVRLDVAVRYQTCSATECLAPDSITLTLEVPEAPAP